MQSSATLDTTRSKQQGQPQAAPQEHEVGRMYPSFLNYPGDLLAAVLASLGVGFVLWIGLSDPPWAQGHLPRAAFFLLAGVLAVVAMMVILSIAGLRRLHPVVLTNARIIMRTPFHRNDRSILLDAVRNIDTRRTLFDIALGVGHINIQDVSGDMIHLPPLRHCEVFVNRIVSLRTSLRDPHDGA